MAPLVPDDSLLRFAAPKIIKTVEMHETVVTGYLAHDGSYIAINVDLIMIYLNFAKWICWFLLKDIAYYMQGGIAQW